jgi:hypothetical protein
MQVQKVLHTIAWLIEVFEPITEMLLAELPGALRRPELPNDPSRAELFRALHKAGAILTQVNANGDAVQVLDAFRLMNLRDAEYVVQIFGKALGSAPSAGPRPEYHDYLRSVVHPWNHMVSCLEPLGDLTLPAELRSLNQGDEAAIFSVELTDRPELTVQPVLDVLEAITKLYQALGEIQAQKDIPPLTIVKIESGTGLTISFKGVADVVKETRKFVIEMWTKHRHKRVEEVINHNRAVASTIDVITRIEHRVKKHLLQPEEGERLKRAVVSNTLTLFRQGALLSDIPRMEVIDNNNLLDGFSSPKLLTAGHEATDQANSEPQDAAGPPHTEHQAKSKQTQRKTTQHKRR